MSMEFAAWNSLYHMMTAQQDRRPFTWATVKRIMGFARPHTAQLVGFLVLSVVGALLAVATPLLAGQVVDLIFAGAPFAQVLRIAVPSASSPSSRPASGCCSAGCRPASGRT